MHDRDGRPIEVGDVELRHVVAGLRSYADALERGGGGEPGRPVRSGRETYREAFCRELAVTRADVFVPEVGGAPVFILGLRLACDAEQLTLGVDDGTLNGGAARYLALNVCRAAVELARRVEEAGS